MAESFADRLRNLGEKSAKRTQSTAKTQNRILQSAAPSTKEITYDEAMERFGHVEGWQNQLRRQGINASSREGFNEFARSDYIQEKRQEWQQEEEALRPLQAESQQIIDTFEKNQKVNQEFRKRIEDMQAELTAVGQGDQETFKDARKVADTAQMLWHAEGADEDTRRNAAWIMTTFRDQFEPHVGAKWYDDNAEELATFGPEEPSWWRKGLSSAGGALMGQLEAMGFAGEQTASGLAGVRAAIHGDIGWDQAIDHGLKRLGALGDPTAYLSRSLGIGDAGLIEGRMGPETYIEVDDGKVYKFDSNEDGFLNFREVLGHEASAGEGRFISFEGSLEDLANKVLPGDLGTTVVEEGADPFGLKGFVQADRTLDAVGLADTIGLALIDPTTYVGLGTANRGRRMLQMARRSGNRRVEAAAARMMDDGVRMTDLPSIQQAEMRTWNRGRVLSELEGKSVPELNAIAAREGLTSPQLLTKWRGYTRDAEKLRDLLVDAKLQKVQRQMDNGAIPAIRFAGRRVVPLKRLQQALGIRERARWVERSQVFRPMEDLAEVNEWWMNTPDELLANMSDDMRRTVRESGGFMDTLQDSPQAALVDVWNAGNGSDVAFDQARRMADELGIDTSKWDDIWANIAENEGKFQPYQQDTLFRQGELIEGPEDFPTWRGRDVTPPDTRPAPEPPPYDVPFEPYQGELIETDPFTSWRGRKVIDEAEIRKINARSKIPGTKKYTWDELPKWLQERMTVDNAAELGWHYLPEEERWIPRILAESEELSFFNIDPNFRTRGPTPELEPLPSQYQGRVLGEPEQLDFGMIDQQFRTIDELPVEQLSPEAMARVKQNMDVFSNPTQWVKQIDRRSLLGAARAKARGLDSAIPTWLAKSITWMSDHFSPRAGIRRADNLGAAIADLVDDQYAMAQAFGDMFEDHLLILGWDKRTGKSKLMEAAKGEESIVAGLDAVKGDTVMEVIGRTLASGEGVELAPALRALDEAGATNTASLIGRLDNIRQDVLKLNMAGEADVNALLAHHGYMPRQNTREAQEALERALELGDTRQLEVLERLGLAEKADGVYIPAAADSTLMQQGHLKGRTYQKHVEDIFQLNEDAAKIWREAGLGDMDFKLYEDDALTSWALRSREAHEGAALMGMFNGLEALDDTAGHKLVYIARAGIDDEATAANRAAVNLRMKGEAPGQAYKAVSLPNGGTAYVNKVIFDDLKNTNRILLEPKTHSRAAQFMNEWNTTWGRYATSPLIGFGFHARNATGNVYNMILGGVTNPKVFSDAHQIQRKLDDIRDLMREQGMGWNAAMQQVPMTDFQRQVIQAARTHNIYNQGGRLADLTAATRGAEEGLTPHRAQRFKDNTLTRQGQAFGNAIENNAKIAMLIDGMQTGLDGQAAAQRVRRYLFDYSDLTAFESDRMRMLNRFYTFARKNTALQIHTLATQPGKIINANRMIDEWAKFWFGEDEGETGDFTAGYTGAGRFIPPWAQTGMKVYGGGSTAAGFETPFTAASEQLDAIAAIAGLPPAYFRLANADDEEREQAYEDWSKQWRDALALTSGGPVEAVKTISEYQSGRDSFTGAKLSNKDNHWWEALTRVTDIAAPIGSKATRFAEGQEWIGDKGEVSDDTFWMNNLLGVISYDLEDPEDAKRAMDMFLSNTQWELTGDKMGWEERTGEEMKTIEELEELGKLDFRNRTVDFFLTSAFDPTFDWDDISPEAQAQLVAGMPKQFMDHYFDIQRPTAEKGTEARDIQDRQSLRDMQRLIDYAEAMGVELTDEMKQEYLILSTDGVTISGLKELGIEPVYLSNEYNRQPGAKPQYAVDTGAALDRIEELYGFDFAETRPLMTSFERRVNQMKAEGYSTEQIQEDILSRLNRQELTYFFGEEALDMEKYDRFTQEDADKLQKRSWELNGIWNVMNAIYFPGEEGPPGTLDRFLAHRLLTNKEERMLGYEPIRTPSREDVRTDAEKLEDSQNKWWAAQSGGDYLSRLQSSNNSWYD